MVDVDELRRLLAEAAPGSWAQKHQGYMAEPIIPADWRPLPSPPAKDTDQ